MKLRIALLAAVAAALSAPASAGSIEDAFRAYLDKLKERGRQLAMRSDAPLVQKPSLAKRTDKLPLGRREYAVFVSPGCRQCDQAVQELRSMGLAFDVLDLSRSDTAREAYPLLKSKGVPAVLVGNYVLSGWDRKLFEQAFKADMQDELRQQQSQGGA